MRHRRCSNPPRLDRSVKRRVSESVRVDSLDARLPTPAAEHRGEAGLSEHSATLGVGEPQLRTPGVLVRPASPKVERESLGDLRAESDPALAALASEADRWDSGVDVDVLDPERHDLAASGSDVDQDP